MPLSKRNRRGVLGIIVIGVSLMFIPRIVKSFSKDVNVTITLADVLEFEKEVAVSKQDRNSFKKKKSDYKRYKIPPKAFDPNEYKKEDWMYLGLSNRQAEVVTQFVQNGVYSDDQLKKIYVLPNELFEILRDSTYYNSKKVQDEHPEIEVEKININKANKTELMTLKGIGPYYADKIISYRSELGGYFSESQLLEIWKFDSEKLNKIRPDIAVVKDEIERININTATIEELKIHPYISFNVANSIVKMRMANGRYETISQIKASRLIDEEMYQKIQPYLTIE